MNEKTNARAEVFKMKKNLVKIGIMISMGALLISCGENTEETEQPAPVAVAPAPVLTPATTQPQVASESTFVPFQGPMNGINQNLVQQFQNLPVQGSNGYSGNFGEYYSMQYQRQGNYNYQYQNPGNYQVFYNGGWQPMN